MDKVGFSTADILLPKHVDMTRWSVIACDQYTSQPDYWERAAQMAGASPSTLNLVLPEVYLEQGDVDRRIAQINASMRAYLDSGLFRVLHDSYVYVERAVAPGKIRRGLVGKIDLEQYDYSAGSHSLVRPTEGTVESRLPPRMRVREQAPLESPHIMVLVDDALNTVIEPLQKQKNTMELLYDFDLMADGGHIAGWHVTPELCARVDAAMLFLLSSQQCCRCTDRECPPPMLIAVGDGNHSLATAKACWERIKPTLSEQEQRMHPARYALAELVNLHDSALAFEPIHRVLFDVDPHDVLKALQKQLGACENGQGQAFTYVTGGRTGRLTVENPPSPLAAGTLQIFIDGYLAAHGGTVDYIHGDDVVAKLSEKPGAIGFLLPAMEKSQLFPAVCEGGALPRKTFSMGHAYEKRFYLECRKIQ
ncbi:MULTISPECIES: DUF1015 domain-containing protein [Anaerotruncus]|jgi:hypothetical protein|uniref:DUF1015 domain-containing protein n=1 Tax=Anaerotruncus TaxID=244127 RepID=UPI00216E4F7C|nr:MULTISPECIES: DUF1015 domain-containing protein [Anaerotruncus]MCI8492436.1 DUF1015 domain-containing protein [Anaerotruncus sp.]